MHRNLVRFGALVLTATATTATPARAGSSVPPDAETHGFAELLAMVPADRVGPDGALVYYSDMTLLWERVGASPDEASRQEAYGELAAVETFSIPPQLFGNRFADTGASQAEVGFTIFDIDRELAVMAPPRNIFIDVTSVAPATIHTAVAANPDWSDRATTVDTDQGSYVDWGDGRDINAELISPFRPLGQAGQLAVVGDPATTVRTVEAADVEAVLAASAGEGESAADAWVTGAVVETLGDDLVMQAVIQPSPTLFSPPLNASPEVIEAIFADAVLVAPYLGVAIVETVDGESTRAEALLVYPDESTAADGAASVETALADGVDLVMNMPLAEVYPDASVSVADNVVRVDVSGEGAFRTLFSQLTSRTLFAS